MSLTQTMTVPVFRSTKGRGKLAVCTAYDYPSAMLAETAGIDAILVGDSVNMVVHGQDNTLTATMDMMILHLRAVSRAVQKTLIIGDMPFLSYTVNDDDAVRNAGRMVAEGGADAVKLEKGTGLASTIKAILRAGIPVMGHVGLTPQSILHSGGFRMQGRAKATAHDIINEAKMLEELGCFSIVLECIPAELAEAITACIGIPTIGIGAGAACDGQVLVWHDMLGLSLGYLPKHARRFAELKPTIQKALEDYVQSVREGTFPGPMESFKGEDGLLDDL